MQFIKSIHELENTPENYKFGVLVLSDNKKEEKTIIDRSESFTDNSILYIYPEINKDYIKIKNHILDEINNRCKSRKVNFNSCILVFKFINKKYNFWSKRVINIPAILEYKVCLNVSELILLVNNKAKEMVKGISTSNIFSKYIDDSLEVNINYSLLEQKYGVGLKANTKKNTILRKIVSV